MPAGRAETHSRALAAFLEAWSQKGLWTHAWVAAGELASEKPVISGLFSPDGRDVFDLASLTKAVVTTPLALELVRRGDWFVDQPFRDAPVAKKNPERFRDVPGALMDFTPRQLLRHESGLPPWRNFYVSCLSQRRGLLDAMKDILREPRIAKPAYSDVGFLALGIVLERSYLSDIANSFYALCKDPNWLSPGFLQPGDQLAFGPDLDTTTRTGRTISTGYCNVRQRELTGEVYDENAWALGGRCAHAGLFGTGAALVNYLRALANSAGGSALLSSQAAELRGNENESLLGWRQGGDPVAAAFGGGKSMGHLGFTGTAFWITPSAHPEKPGRYAVVLTNRTVSGRLNPAIKDFRRGCLEILWQAV